MGIIQEITSQLSEDEKHIIEGVDISKSGEDIVKDLEKSEIVCFNSEIKYDQEIQQNT